MTPLVSEIKAAVADHFDLDPGDLESHRRYAAIAHPRQLAMFLSRALTPRSFPQIAKRFGNRDHTTVIHAVRRVDERLRTDQETAEHARIIIEALAMAVAYRQRIAVIHACRKEGVG